MKKYIGALYIVLALVLIVATLGCGGDGDDEDEEEKIRALVDERISCMNSGDYETVYNMATPEWRERVTYDELYNFLMVAMGEFITMVQSGEAEVAITDINIRVDGDWAYMTGTQKVGGMSIQEYTEDTPDVWQKIDGTWYNVQTDPRFPGYDPGDLPE